MEFRVLLELLGEALANREPGDWTTIYGFSTIAALILLIAAINFMNLLNIWKIYSYLDLLSKLCRRYHYIYICGSKNRTLQGFIGIHCMTMTIATSTCNLTPYLATVNC